MNSNATKTPFQLYFRLLKNYPGNTLLFAGCTLISGITIFLIFSSIGILLTNVVALVNGDMAFNASQAILYIVIIIIFSLLSSFSEVGFVRVEQNLQKDLREKMINSYMKMNEKFSEQYTPNEVLNRFTYDLPACTPVMGTYMSGAVFQPILSGILSVLLLCFIDIRIAVLCLICTALNLFFSQFAVKKLRNIKMNIVKNKSEVVNFMQECADGSIEIRTFKLAALFEKYIHSKLKDTSRHIRHLENINAFRLQLVVFSSDCLTIVSLLILGAFLSSLQIINFSDIMLSIPLSDQIGQMMASFGSFNTVIKQTAPHLERVFEIVHLPKEPSHENQKTKEDNISFCSGITFNNVSFSYGKDTVLKELTFKIKSGEKVAFVGESGSGKSTIIKLLLGLYQPESGSINTNGKILNHCSVDEWRKEFSYIPQKVSMFNLTIGENISLTHNLYKTDSIVEASKKADADSFITQQKDNYSLILSEDNTGLSGGQLQRIALARCFYKKSPVIVMDEPTASLDVYTEDAIRETIEQIPDNQTVIVVTHRLELVKNFNKLFVLNKGRIIESGTHKELLEKQGKYTELWNIQHQL